MKMDELLFKYADAFDENFPMYLFRTADENEVSAIIQKCLDDGVPYEADFDEDMKY